MFINLEFGRYFSIKPTYRKFNGALSVKTLPVLSIFDIYSNYSLLDLTSVSLLINLLSK